LHSVLFAVVVLELMMPCSNLHVMIISYFIQLKPLTVIITSCMKQALCSIIVYMAHAFICVAALCSLSFSFALLPSVVST